MINSQDPMTHMSTLSDLTVGLHMNWWKQIAYDQKLKFKENNSIQTTVTSIYRKPAVQINKKLTMEQDMIINALSNLMVTLAKT